MYEKKSVQYISEITKFKKEQIENEIAFLVKYGLVSYNQELDLYLLSDLGESIVTKIDEIDLFNSKNIKVLIDKYTGAVIKYRDDLVKVEGGYYKIVKDTYKNLNPVNSKRFFKENYNYYFTKSSLEDLDVELYLEDEYWIEIGIDKLRGFIDIDIADGFINNEKVYKFLLSVRDESLINIEIILIR